MYVWAAGGRIETKKWASKKEKKATEIMLRKAPAHVLIKQKKKTKFLNGCCSVLKW